MLEKGKISAFQMGMITYTAIIATGAITAKAADRNNVAVADLGFPNRFSNSLYYISIEQALSEGDAYPVQCTYSRHNPGKNVGFFYLFYLLFLIHLSSGFTETSCAFAVRGGVEVLGRARPVDSSHNDYALGPSIWS